MAGRDGSRRAPRPSSTSSKAGSTLVPPGANRGRTWLAASTASRSASTDSSSQVPSADWPSRPSSGRRACSAKGLPDALEDAMAVGADHLARLGGVGLEQLALATAELRGHRHMDHDVEIAAAAGPSKVRHTAPAEANLGPGLDPRLDVDRLIALDGRDRDLRPERGLRDREAELVEQLRAVAAQPRMRLDADRAAEAALRSAPRTSPAFSGETGLVAVVDPRRELDAEGARLCQAPI